MLSVQGQNDRVALVDVDHSRHEKHQFIRLPVVILSQLRPDLKTILALSVGCILLVDANRVVEYYGQRNERQNHYAKVDYGQRRESSDQTNRYEDRCYNEGVELLLAAFAGREAAAHQLV